MKNRTTSNAAETWGAKTVNHHPDVFAGCHLLTVQKPASEYCDIRVERFIGNLGFRTLRAEQ